KCGILIIGDMPIYVAHDSMDVWAAPEQFLLDENFNPVYNKDGKAADQNTEESELTAAEADLQKLEEGRYKFYKLATDELAKYQYGKGGKTLRDFFVSLAKEDDESVLYPLASVLTAGEFAALSYGCFLELTIGANATEEDFDSYDEMFADITEEAASVYLYRGVNQALFEDEAIIGFTDTAQRHMATTGDLEFFESDNPDEAAWDTGTRIVTGIGVACMAVMGLAKISVGVTALVAFATSTQSAAMAATIKYGTLIGGLKGLIVAAVIVAVSLLITYLVAISAGEEVDWENDPMLQYVFDVKEATFMQASDDGVATEFMRRPEFVFYEAVTDIDGGLVDLNARSEDATRWIQLFISRDKLGVDSKPIKCDSVTGAPLLVQKGNGIAPEGSTPVTHFGEVVAYNLNQWDEEDTVSGIYLFYQRDMEIAVDNGKTLYISEVQLQSGESDAHCIKLLQDAGYTPININLSPDLTDGDFMFEDKIYTYLGYKTSTSEASAIRDIRLIYGPAQGAIQYGAATYAACGSNGAVTLYATKYEISGTPLLAGGLICVDKQSKAPLGYEPVCLMTGGPAVPVNVNTDGEIREDNGFLYLYFLPETTFTSGKQYLGGIATFEGGAGVYDGYYTQIPISSATKELWGDYVPAAGDWGLQRYLSMIAYYPTYNPYRAIYGIKAVSLPGASKSLFVEGTPYYAWN
ncbi:MAG: 4-alpha-glucanotransferase, partial [Clostridia bacterium]|nr:4-alpha-glucanotransferase [Clostridia bacterium]